MKSTILILILTLVLGVGISIFNSASVIAADEGDVALSMEGIDTATKGGTGTINLKINASNDKITTISGTIIKDEKISKISI